MNAVRLSNLVDGLDPSHRLQSHLRLELRQVHFALLRFAHVLPISCDSVLLKLLSHFWGSFYLAALTVKAVIQRLQGARQGGHHIARVVALPRQTHDVVHTGTLRVC